MRNTKSAKIKLGRTLLVIMIIIIIFTFGSIIEKETLKSLSIGIKCHLQAQGRSKYTRYVRRILVRGANAPLPPEAKKILKI